MIQKDILLRFLFSILTLAAIGVSAYIMLPGADSITSSSPVYLAEMKSDFVVWMLICAILVLFMQAGFLLLEAGMVRSKNSINVAQKNASDFVICGVVFFLFGFQMTFGQGTSPFFGFGGIDPMEGNASALVVMIYQFGFCATAATIVSGAVAERMKFASYLCLAVFMSAVIYPLFAHLVWGNAILPENPAYLADLGFIDFAGSTVVHSTAAWVALAAIIILGARKDRFDENGNPREISGHSSVLAFMGTVILLIGWIGFNAGAVKPQAPELPQIIANTIVAASFGATAGMVIGYVKDNGLFKPMATMTGLLGGLVAVTAGVSVLSISGAALVGMAGGSIAIVGSFLLANFFKLDDPLDVVPIHGFAGITGTLLLVPLGDIRQMVNTSRLDQLYVQLEGIGINFLWSFGLAVIFLSIAKKVWGIRVSEEEELVGLNAAEHGVSLGIDRLRTAIDKTLENPDSINNESVLQDFRIDIDQGEESAEIATAFNTILDKHTSTIVKLDKATKEAQSASKAKSEFLANMSHEIRTPMNGVMGMAEILHKTELNDKQRSFVTIIMSSATSLLSVINDILDFSKIEAGKISIEKKPFDLQSMVSEVMQMLSSRISEKKLEMIVRIRPDVPQMFIGDIGRIRQMLVNITGNSIKFSEKGHVLIDIEGKQVEGDDWKIRFNIKDTGIGIAEDKIDAIFEKFSQVDNSTKRNHDGTGLGLAITSKLAKLMDGDIGVTSEVGKGSHFWFEVTMQNDTEYVKPSMTKTILKNKRILVVDDNLVNQEILEEQLTLWDTEYASCGSGKEAISFLQACAKNNVKIDAMILDYHMPQMNGLELLREVRSMPAYNKTPTMLLTSVDYIEDNERSSSHLGFQDIVHKTALANEILRSLTTILDPNQLPFDNGIDAVKQLSKSPSDTLNDATEQSFKEALSDKPINCISSITDHVQLAVQDTSTEQDTYDVIIAEDNPINQIVYTETLKSTALKYKIVENGEDAVEAYKKYRPNVMCMDVSMPVMDGHTATRAIRDIEKQNDLPQTPIIGITAHALNGDREKCIDSGMNDYLPKPVSPEAFISKIMSWMENSDISQKL